MSGPPIPGASDPARVALAVAIWRRFDDRTRQIMEMMPRHFLVERCRPRDPR